MNNRLSQRSVEAGCIAINSTSRPVLLLEGPSMTIYHAKTEEVDYTDLNNAALDRNGLEKYIDRPEKRQKASVRVLSLGAGADRSRF